MLKNIALVALGGGVGSVFRYLTSVYVSKMFVSSFPFGTFVVNLTGCLIIGFLIELSAYTGWFDSNLRMLLITGFCGGYTTFSAFSAENFVLYQSGHQWTMILYIGLSVLLGMIALYGGILLAKLITGR